MLFEACEDLAALGAVPTVFTASLALDLGSSKAARAGDSAAGAVADRCRVDALVIDNGEGVCLELNRGAGNRENDGEGGCGDGDVALRVGSKKLLSTD